MELNIRKRDGSIEAFELTKISSAMKKAFEATETLFATDILDTLALKVTATLTNSGKFVKGEQGMYIADIESVQDAVEAVLSETGYTEVAKAYILYRKNREKIRNISKTQIDYKELINSYVDNEDWRTKENASVTYSLGGLILNNSGAVTANYWLSEIYDEEIGNAHRNADIHIHDLSMLSGYCAGWSLKQFIKEGLGGVPGKISSAPAKHLSTLCNQMVNFLGIMQNEWAGQMSARVQANL